MSSHDHDIFTPRAISDDVRDERGYRRYEAGKTAHDVLRQVDPRLLRPEHAAWLRGVLDVGGWAMPRHRVPGGSWPYTQLRPDRPVKARRQSHRHSGMKHRPGRCYCGQEHNGPPVLRSKINPDAWKPDAPEWVSWYDWWQPPLSRKARAHHEAHTCEWVKPVYLPDWVRPLEERDDGKVLAPTGHLHPDTGRLVLPWKANGRERIHSHLDWAKYVYVNGEGKAAGIGTHPRVARALERGIVAPEGLFVFVIEGTLKLDAVVSAEWPGIESGSVTLWNAEEEEFEAEVEVGDFGEPYLVGRTFMENELENFAHDYLEGVPTVIVCDSDADTNPLVRRQVAQAVELLRACDVPAVGGAPPPGEALGWRHPVYGTPMHAKQGVDDWLATMDASHRHDGFLDLHVWDEKADPPGLTAAVEEATTPKGAHTQRETLRELARESLPSGHVDFRPGAIAQRIGRKERNVRAARERAEKLGHLETIIEAEPVSDGNGGVRSIPPLLRLRPDLRRPESDRTLRDWLDDLS